MKLRLFVISLMIPISIFSQNKFKVQQQAIDTIAVLKDFDMFNSRSPEFAFTMGLAIDYQRNNFSQFSSLLGDYNVNLMNNSSGTAAIELNGYLNNIAIGLNLGNGSNSDHFLDSLNLDFNTTKLGLLFGYRLFENKRFLLIPNIVIRWNHYRLINSDKDSKIPITQYLIDRELDIRFNQFTTSTGLQLEYKFYRYFPWAFPFDHASVGLYGGYIFQLNQKPLTYSLKTHLATNEKIKIQNLNVRLSFTFYFI